MARLLLNSVRKLMPLLAAFALPAGAYAWCGHPGCLLVDANTKYNWAHTWCDPNALETPLNKYCIQRVPRICGRDSYINRVNCQDGVGAGVNQYGALPYPSTAAAGFEPVQFERLGKIPNEMDRIGGAVTTVLPVVAPRRTPGPADTMLLPK